MSLTRFWCQHVSGSEPPLLAGSSASLSLPCNVFPWAWDSCGRLSLGNPAHDRLLVASKLELCCIAVGREPESPLSPAVLDPADSTWSIAIPEATDGPTVEYECVLRPACGPFFCTLDGVVLKRV